MNCDFFHHMFMVLGVFFVCFLALFSCASVGIMVSGFFHLRKGRQYFFDNIFISYKNTVFFCCICKPAHMIFTANVQDNNDEEEEEEAAHDLISL